MERAPTLPVLLECVAVHSRGTYAASYVRPERWSLTLNGCGSSGAGEKIVSYEWTIRGVTVDGFKAHRSGAVCNLTLNNVLPARGRVRGVTLLVKTTSGASDGSTQPIEIKRLVDRPIHRRLVLLRRGQPGSAGSIWGRPYSGLPGKDYPRGETRGVEGSAMSSVGTVGTRSHRRADRT